jgi:hypothetical protein
MLIVLGLATVAWLSEPGWWEGLGPTLSGSAVLAFLGSVFWTLGWAGTGRAVAGVLLVVLGWTLVSTLASAAAGDPTRSPRGILVPASAVASALLLGSMTAAMLLGHSYLVSPSMAIEPLKNQIALVGWSLAGRTLLAALGLLPFVGRVQGLGWPPDFGGFWCLMLAARWFIGLVAPAVIAWMAWQTAKIRATQSATGILYAGVILVFLGELTSQLLTAHLGFAL